MGALAVASGRAGVALLALAGGLVLSCATPHERGVFHPVKEGETVYRIARYYGVRVDTVVRANRVGDVRDVHVGTRLWIPNATRRPPGRPLPGPVSSRGRPLAETRSSAQLLARERGLSFTWPVRGELTSRFGWRRGRRHEGIDVANRHGAAVRAAEDGRVIYSGRGLGAYGNVVIVRHDTRYETVYAHNRRNRVAKGALVRKGQVIAEVGATGNATGPHLHFEIRENDRARDPLLYLP